MFDVSVIKILRNAGNTRSLKTDFSLQKSYYWSKPSPFEPTAALIHTLEFGRLVPTHAALLVAFLSSLWRKILAWTSIYPPPLRAFRCILWPLWVINVKKIQLVKIKFHLFLSLIFNFHSFSSQSQRRSSRGSLQHKVEALHADYHHVLYNKNIKNCKIT